MTSVHGTTAQTTAQPAAAVSSSNSRADAIDRLQVAIEHASHLLPAQGPITVFIHHNTLHAFEDLPFDEAVKKGGRIFGCHPYLPENRYREKLARGRIRITDLEAVLRKNLGTRADESVLGLATRLELRLAMLQYELRTGPSAELRWFVAETDALRRVRRDAPVAVREQLIDGTREWILRDVCPGADHHVRKMLADLFRQFDESTVESWSDETWEAFSLRALWRICTQGVHGVEPSAGSAARPVRHRDLLLLASGIDSDAFVQEVLIRFCAAFLDQGFANWPLPRRDEGLFDAFSTLYRQSGDPPDRWMRGLAWELERIHSSGLRPFDTILESLEQLGVVEAEWEEYLSATLVALRGWAGMVRQVEIRTDSVAHPIGPGSLVEMLAVQLLLERLSLKHLAESALGWTGPLNQLRATATRRITPPSPPTVEQRAFLEFQLAQILGWTPDRLNRLTKPQWGELVREIESFSSIERRRIFHLAFERLYHTRTLDALAIRSRSQTDRSRKPKYQVVCCLDEREESFRRHLEELSGDVETYGAAGFFGVPMYYRGAGDAHFVPLCPVVIRPQHWVAERVMYSLEQDERRRARTRRAIGQASHQVHVRSRTFAAGTLLAVGPGILASIPLVARILFPRLTAKVRQLAGGWVAPPRGTQLHLERVASHPGPEEERLGFHVEEMATNAERLLRDMGLTADFSRLVLIVGHGSSSLNNPHNSAYQCGACGGSCGGPNARAMAQILNDSRVRRILSERGLSIPPETAFVGAWHNTCSDAVTYFDLDRLPPLHRHDLEALCDLIDVACERNAHERCRRFQSAPLTMTVSEARRHVEERSEDLAQTRPECGHATNAVCFVGRRQRTSGLFMDRRTFLASYDALQDDQENSVLTRILQAVIPVCGGINLEYYFSYVDSAGWGCGTKLPHNVTALLGVMDGAASDLRTGLPWQMVEIHEPVRILFVIEAELQVLMRLMERDPSIAKLCRNGWIQLATLDPHSDEIHVFEGDSFQNYVPECRELPLVPSSVDWYRGQRDHLPYAIIQRA